MGDPVVFIRVTDKTQVVAAIHEAMAYDGPAIIDFRVEQEENVYPMIPSGTTVHDMIEEPAPEKARR